VSIDPAKYQDSRQIYQCHKLVYHEHYSEVDEAIAREKQLKRWLRTKKISLIGRVNPRWLDLPTTFSEISRDVSTPLDMTRK